MLLLRAGVEPRYTAISLTNARHLSGDNQTKAVVSSNIYVSNIYVSNAAKSYPTPPNLKVRLGFSKRG